MKPRVSRNLLPALLLVATVVVAINAWAAFYSEDQLLQSEYWVHHTWQGIYQLERIMGSAKDAETGARGYLITADPSYLAPFDAARRDLPREVEIFASLVTDNPSQQARLPRLRAIVNARIVRLQAMVDLRRTRNLASVSAQVEAGVGQHDMEQLRSLVEDAQNEERRLLVMRTARTHHDSLRARATIGFASGLDFLLIALVFRFLFRERELRLISEDTAERLAISQAQTQANAEEVLKLNATLEERVNFRTAELATSNRELEAFSYSVSHDLRAPLRTIDGFSLALEEDYASLVDEVGRDYIRRVRTGVQRMGQLIDALLQLSRITRAELAREPVDLTLLAQNVAADLAHSDEGKKTTFRIEEGLTVSADPRLLQVALENLMGNAVKFSSKRADALVEVGWDRDQGAWFIRDNGAGFDMYYAEKLFNAFNRLHGDKDFKGSGIGLATVARVIQRHHGRVWAESVVDHGATFRFTLG